MERSVIVRVRSVEVSTLIKEREHLLRVASIGGIEQLAVKVLLVH